MNGTRQQIQYSLALEPVNRGEPPVSGHQGAEPWVAKPAPESPAVTEQLMEEMCDREKERGNAFDGTRAVLAWMGCPSTTPGTTCVSTGQAFGLNCSREPTSRGRSGGSKYPSRTAGSESSACLASSTD